MGEQDSCTALTGRLYKPDNRLQMPSVSAVTMGLGRPWFLTAPGVHRSAFPPRWRSVTCHRVCCPRDGCSSALAPSGSGLPVHHTEHVHVHLQPAGRGWFYNSLHKCAFWWLQYRGRDRVKNSANFLPKATSQCKVTHRAQVCIIQAIFNRSWVRNWWMKKLGSFSFQTGYLQVRKQFLLCFSCHMYLLKSLRNWKHGYSLPGELPIKQHVSRNYNRNGLLAESSTCSLHCSTCSYSDNVCYPKNVTKTLPRVGSSNRYAMRYLQIFFLPLIQKGEPSIV